MRDKESFKSYLKAKGYKEQSIETYCKYVNQYLYWLKENSLKVNSIKYADAIKYLSFLHTKKIKKQTTAVNILSISYYYEFRYKKKNPFHYVKVRSEKVQINNLIPIDIINATYDGFTKAKNQSEAIYFRNKVVLSLIIFQYVRLTELEQLTLDDVDLIKGEIILRGNDRINRRVLPISNKQFYFISEYKNKYREEIASIKKGESNKFIITMGKGVRLSNLKQSLFNELGSYKENKLTWNNIRNSLIVELVKKENLRIVQYKIGHKYISSTERYKITDIEELKRKVIKFHPF